MKNLLLGVGFLLVFMPCAVVAQTKADEKYRKESEDIRKEIWAWDKKQFKNRTVPQEYNKYSKVVLAHHTELTADSKTKFAFYVVTFGAKLEQKIIEVVREMIKLNDKTAVDEYSEISFTRFQRSSGFVTSDNLTTYIGVRVIKPDGKIKEVNADEIVLTKDASNEKKAKLAIPDLQPGDIIDYFIASTQNLTNDFTEKKFNIILFDDAPILNYSFHGALGKKYAVEYRSYNGAPTVKVGKDADDGIIIDVDKNNIAPMETTLWISAAQQLPFIRLNISRGLRGGTGERMGVGKPGEIAENKNNEEILKEKASSLSSSYYWDYWMKNNRAQYEMVEDAARKKAKQLDLDFKQMSEEDKLALIFYTFRYTNLINFDINKLQRTLNSGNYEFNGLGFVLFCAAKASGLEPAILSAPPRTGFRLQEVLDKNDLVDYAYLPGSKKFFYLNSIYGTPFSVPQDFEGIKKSISFTFRHPTMIMGNAMYNLTEKADGFAVPLSTAEQNSHKEQVALTILPNLSNIGVKRKSVVKGLYKEDLQRQLILYEDFYEHERLAFKDEQSLLERLEDDKKGKKYVDEVKSAFAEARKKQKEAFEREAKGWFGVEITELKNHKVENMGVRHTAPDMVYSSEFNMGGLVKKAGNNLILEIGKVLGEQLIIKETQRKRDLDVYMPFARSIENEIVLNIPAGYTVEGVNELNRNVENVTGFFKVEAAVKANQVVIKVKKHYLHNYEPKENWEKMLAFLDAANDWLGAKLLLKKQ